MQLSAVCISAATAPAEAAIVMMELKIYGTFKIALARFCFAIAVAHTKLRVMSLSLALFEFELR